MDISQIAVDDRCILLLFYCPVIIIIVICYINIKIIIYGHSSLFYTDSTSV